MSKSLIEESRASFNAAQQDQEEMLKALSLFSQSEKHSDDPIALLQDLQLVLQYRLDSQEVLRQILLCQQALAGLLGISLKNSADVNMDRLAYALGEEDLHHLLTMLNQLAEALLRLVQRKSKENKERREALESKKQLRSGKKTAGVESEASLIKKALLKQQSFLFHLKQLAHQLESLAGQPVVGPVYDYLAQLEGPVSHFYQAQQNGLVLSAGLYQQLAQKSKTEQTLTEVLSLSKLALQQSMPHLEANRLFKPELEQNLEARAAAKRLRPFIIGS